MRAAYWTKVQRLVHREIPEREWEADVPSKWHHMIHDRSLPQQNLADHVSDDDAFGEMPLFRLIDVEEDDDNDNAAPFGLAGTST